MNNGDPAHRQKVQRRRESRDRRHELIKQIMATTLPHCRLSKIGVAVSTREYGNRWGEYHVSKDGPCKVREDGLRMTMTDLEPWNDISEQRLLTLSGRDNWGPRRPKNALVLLAEQAE